MWLDHFSFNAANYKTSVSFHNNLLGWGPTYDEGSQNELMIGDVGGSIQELSHDDAQRIRPADQLQHARHASQLGHCSQSQAARVK